MRTTETPFFTWMRRAGENAAHRMLQISSSRKEKIMAKPIVAVVGRPNVGKSTLFNKLVGKRISIVEDTPGVTRDRIYAECEWLNKSFMLVDTGGIEPNTDDVLLSQMRRQGSGVIVNIGSVTGEEGDPCAVAYAASKSGAMRGLTKSVALAGAKYGIRCVGVAPGPVMTRPGMAAMKTLIGRGADPIEIVNIVLFLASSHADSVTGTYILADGGRSVMRDKEHGDYGKYGK